MPAVRAALRKLLRITFPALLASFLLLELAARVFLPVSDFPATTFHPELGNHFVPGQEGTYVKGPRSEIRARFRINAQGWNASRDFVLARTPGTLRLAVIGDSYVEAMQVDPAASFPAALEARLARPGRPVEVYPFGHSGAALPQYLQVLEREACRYRPDLVLVSVVHNDFVESLAGRGRIDNWTLHPVAGGFADVPPAPPGNRRLKGALRHLALARYLVINLDVVSRVAFARRLFYGDARNFEANVDPAALGAFSDPAFRDTLLAEIVSRARRTTDACGARGLVLVLDANRRAFYAGADPRTGEVSRLMQAMAATAARQGVPVLDLHDAFAASWARERRRFDWPIDNHWNEHGHAVVAEAIARFLSERGLVGE